MLFAIFTSILLILPLHSLTLNSAVCKGEDFIILTGKNTAEEYDCINDKYIVACIDNPNTKDCRLVSNVTSENSRNFWCENDCNACPVARIDIMNDESSAKSYALQQVRGDRHCMWLAPYERCVLSSLGKINCFDIPEECVPIKKLLNNNQIENCCLEEGITCNYGSGGHITRIGFANKAINGSIPSEFNMLSKLVYLDLSNNSINGPIPPELGKLSKLEFLNLSNNNLNGPIPPELGELPNILSIDLNNNNLNGTIPPEFGNLQKLTNLNLSNNKFDGSFPSELGNLTKIKTFDFSNNNFCGDYNIVNAQQIIKDGNPNLGKECPDDKAQNNNNGKISRMTLIIIGGIALLLILIILAYFINKNKYDGINISHISEKDLLDYTFVEEKYYEWKIDNWNQLSDKEYSSVFEANKHLWKIMLITNSFNENNKESVDVGLSLCDEIDDNDFIYANFEVFFCNYNNNKVNDSIEYDDKPTCYNARTPNHGINNAILKSELYKNKNNGCSILEDNRITIGILIRFYSL